MPRTARSMAARSSAGRRPGSEDPGVARPRGTGHLDAAASRGTSRTDRRARWRPGCGRPRRPSAGSPGGAAASWLRMISAPIPRDWNAGRTWRAARYQTCSRWTAIPKPTSAPSASATQKPSGSWRSALAAEREEALRRCRPVAASAPSRGSRARCVGRLADDVVRRARIVGRRPADRRSRARRSGAATSVIRLALVDPVAHASTRARTAGERRHACRIDGSTGGWRS